MSQPVTFSDYCTCELVAATTNSQTTMLVSVPGEPFPTLGAGATYFYLTIVDQPSYIADSDPPAQREIVKVTAYSTVSTGYSLTVVRAITTTAQIWASGSIVQLRPCAQGLLDLKTSAAASLIVTDGGVTVNPTTTISFVSGATVTDLGSGQAGVVVVGATVTSGWWYGTGEDGTATLDGSATVTWASKSGSVYTMTRSVALASLTVNNGVTLKTAGYVIYCSITLTNNGTISNSGLLGVVAGAGYGAPGNCYGGGADTSGIFGASPTASLGGGSVKGGDSNEHVNPYGPWPATLPTEAKGGIACACSIHCATTGRAFDGTLITGGSSGGGGMSNAAFSGSNGIGGGGGGVIGIFAKVTAGTGSVQALGGAGSTGGAAGCGGGSGGGGGVVFLITTTTTVLSSWSVSVAGGAAGAGNGSSAWNGYSGSAGRIIAWYL